MADADIIPTEGHNPAEARPSSKEFRESLKEYDEENQNIHDTIQEILNKKKVFVDEKDESVHPSFTNFKVPYHMTCQLRYSQRRQEYEKQFQHELNEMLNHQPTAYDAARFSRHLSITTLWPPLHNRREIEYFQNYFFKLNRKQKKRLEFIMNTNII